MDLFRVVGGPLSLAPGETISLDARQLAVRADRVEVLGEDDVEALPVLQQHPRRGRDAGELPDRDLVRHAPVVRRRRHGAGGGLGVLDHAAQLELLEAAAALQALERVPMTDQEFTAWIESSGFVIEPHTAWTIKELVERHHNITPPPPEGKG